MTAETNTRAKLLSVALGGLALAGLGAFIVVVSLDRADKLTSVLGCSSA